MSTFLLVPGAWLDGWCWQHVAGDLHATGHTVIPASPEDIAAHWHRRQPQIDGIDDLVFPEHGVIKTAAERK